MSSIRAYFNVLSVHDFTWVMDSGPYIRVPMITISLLTSAACPGRVALLSCRSRGRTSLGAGEWSGRREVGRRIPIFRNGLTNAELVVEYDLEAHSRFPELDHCVEYERTRNNTEVS